MKYVVTVNDETHVVDVSGQDGRYRVEVGDADPPDGREPRVIEPDPVAP